MKIKQIIKNILKRVLPQKVKNWLKRIRANSDMSLIKEKLYRKTYLDKKGFKTNNNGTCTLFASFDKDGIINEYVLYYLKQLKQFSESIIFIADNRLKDPNELKKINGLVDYAIFVHHGGYDFGSWKKGYKFLSKKKLLSKYSNFILVNDSCYGPIGDLKNTYTEMNSKNYDFWGLCDSKDGCYHLQSFFINCNQKVFSSNVVRKFFLTLPNRMSFLDAVNLGEKRFTKMLSEQFKSGCLFPGFSTDNARAYLAGNRNGTVWPYSMVKAGFPLVKIKALTGAFGKDLQENILDTLNYIEKENKTLYEIIIRDLKRRKNNNLDYIFHDLGEDLSKAIENKYVISFDIFDTLLIRPFANPSDLFKFIENEEGVKGFSEERIRAEKRARLISKFEEITFDEIYDCILPRYRFLKSIELDYEMNLLKANPIIVSIYKQAVESGKKIIAISDMYLSKSFLETVLKKNGFEEISEIFVSSEYRKNKGSKGLYTEAISKMNIKPEDMIHIGDNEIADYALPTSLGVSCYKILKITEKFNTPGNLKWQIYHEKSKSIESGIHLNIISRHAILEKLNNTSYFQMLGYRLGGPLALSYLTFVLKKALENRIQKILFVSRDGWILKEVYDKFLYDIYKIPCEYVYLQRIVGLKATLDWSDEPIYLKKLLNMFNIDNAMVLNVSDDYESNKLEFETHRENIQSWSKKSSDEFRSHIENAVGDSKCVGLVDMTTGAFSSLRYVKDVLTDVEVIGFFSGSFKENEKETYIKFYDDLFVHSDDPILKLSETLISSPESNVIGLQLGKPIYQNDDDTRSNVYNLIANGILEYSRDMLSLFGTKYSSALFSMQEWKLLSGHFISFLNDIDIYELSKIHHSDLFQNENTKNFYEMLISKE